MLVRGTLPIIVALATACTPALPILAPNTDAGAVDVAASDQGTPADSIDVATPDVAPTADTPAPDVAAVDAPFDVPISPDLPPVVDAPVVVDVPIAVDLPSPLDAGSCPAGMVLIPSGTFTMGDADAASLGAQPPHSVTLSAFCMDLTEVTVAAYSACTATGCAAPNTGLHCNWGVSGRGDHPVNCVDWNQSRAYCQWRGGELPTEAQWEYAARGSDGRPYPWGNATPTSQLCWSGAGTRTDTCPVGSFSTGASPFGVLDMAGNVWEWTADWYAPYSATAATDPTGPASGTARIDRGEDWSAVSPPTLRAAYRNPVPPAYRDGFLGFRCAHAPR